MYECAAEVFFKLNKKWLLQNVLNTHIFPENGKIDFYANPHIFKIYSNMGVVV